MCLLPRMVNAKKYQNKSPNQNNILIKWQISNQSIIFILCHLPCVDLLSDHNM